MKINDQEHAAFCRHIVGENEQGRSMQYTYHWFATATEHRAICQQWERKQIDRVRRKDRKP